MRVLRWALQVVWVSWWLLSSIGVCVVFVSVDVVTMSMDVIDQLCGCSFYCCCGDVLACWVQVKALSVDFIDHQCECYGHQCGRYRPSVWMLWQSGWMLSTAGLEVWAIWVGVVGISVVLTVRRAVWMCGA